MSARLLLERISLRGICRVGGVGLRWLLPCMGDRFAAAPERLYIRPLVRNQAVSLQRLEAEVDESWSFVGTKANRQWVWIAMDTATHHLMAFHVGDRSGRSAKALWEQIPAMYPKRATCYTEQYKVDKAIIPCAQHRPISTLARKTNRHVAK